MKGICESFPVTSEEYKELEYEFGKLAKKASWELLRKNHKNNHTDEFDDINQELIMSMLRAGSYFKRQVYIEQCLEVAKNHAKDGFLLHILEELENLWNNRTRHGANRQKYGPLQEEMLERIVKKYVAKKYRPDKKSNLLIDKKFSTYCKTIVWNAQKSMGRKITREKSLRTGQVSLSDFEYLTESMK